MSQPFGNDATPKTIAPTPTPTSSTDFQPPSSDGFPWPQNPESVTPADYFNNPSVPGDSGSQKKGQTSTNTTALKTFATNADALAAQLKQLEDPLSQVALKPGVFETASDRILDPILGSGRLRDNTLSVVQNVVRSLNDLSDKVAQAARDYESIDDFNKITMDKYNSYFSGVNSEISSGLSKPAGSS